jgi:hypothetical protein
MKIRATRTLALIAGSAACCVFVGCASSGRSDAAETAAIRANLTPELDTLYQRPDDVENVLSLMDDENWRMFTQDLGRAFYTDRPSRLTREPVPW